MWTLGWFSTDSPRGGGPYHLSPSFLSRSFLNHTFVVYGHRQLYWSDVCSHIPHSLHCCVSLFSHAVSLPPTLCPYLPRCVPFLPRCVPNLPRCVPFLTRPGRPSTWYLQWQEGPCLPPPQQELASAGRQSCGSWSSHCRCIGSCCTKPHALSTAQVREDVCLCVWCVCVCVCVFVCVCVSIYSTRPHAL